MLILIIVNFTGTIIRIFIFNKSAANEDKNIFIWMLCCRIGKRPNEGKNFKRLKFLQQKILKNRSNS